MGNEAPEGCSLPKGADATLGVCFNLDLRNPVIPLTKHAPPTHALARARAVPGARVCSFFTPLLFPHQGLVLLPGLRLHAGGVQGRLAKLCLPSGRKQLGGLLFQGKNKNARSLRGRGVQRAGAPNTAERGVSLAGYSPGAVPLGPAQLCLHRIKRGWKCLKQHRISGSAAAGEVLFGLLSIRLICFMGCAWKLGLGSPSVLALLLATGPLLSSPSSLQSSSQQAS